MSQILLLMFSSRIFVVSGLTFKSLIHFEFLDSWRPSCTYIITYLIDMKLVCTLMPHQYFDIIIVIIKHIQ